MEAVINNTKLIRRVNIFALLILAVCVCAVAFLCKNMWLHIACTAALFLVMTIFGYWGKGLKFLVAFLISYGWLTFNVRHGINRLYVCSVYRLIFADEILFICHHLIYMWCGTAANVSLDC